MSEYLLINILIIVACLAVSAFFSAAETSLTAISRARLFHLVKEGNKRATKVDRLRKNKESLLGTILLGNNSVNIIASTLATAVGLQLFGHYQEGVVAIVVVLMTFLTVVFTEILPKTYAIQHVERVALGLAPLLQPIVWLLSPIINAIQWGIRASLKPFGIHLGENSGLVAAGDALRGVIELHHSEGHMERQDRDMLGSILDLNDIEVRSIMVHRTHVDMICADHSAEVMIREAISMLHSRIPLWQENPDNIIGILHVKDLVRAINLSATPLDKETILAIAHKPWFIPETTTLRDQLLAFRARRQHFAIVVDEYGALLGIVTLEDIIEEIVGEISDEHDEQAAGGIQKAGPNLYYVAGDVAIRDINRELDWELPDEYAATVGGLVIHEARAIPSKGQHFDLGKFRFTVVDKNSKQIKRLKVEKLPEPEDEAGVP